MMEGKKTIAEKKEKLNKKQTNKQTNKKST